MKIVETIFDHCFAIEPSLREDNRGLMEVLYSKREQTGLFQDFEILGKHPLCGVALGNL